MGRVSLTESYDDRSVIAKLNEMDKRVTENTTVVTAAEASAKASAQAAQETADRFAGSVGAVVQNANAQINASKAQVDQAKAEVDETVTTVAQAVQTANQASASAQQSAQTVAGYDGRLTAVEDADTKNVKLDTDQTITGHKKFVQTGTAGVPLEAERKGNGAGLSITQTDQRMTDSGVQYYTGMYVYDGNGNRVGGWYPVKEDDNRTTIRMRHNNTDGTTRELVIDGDFVLSNSIVSKKYVESTDGATNNLVHRSANEKVDGIKTFVQRVDFDSSTVDLKNPPSYASRGMSQVNTGSNLDVVAMREEMLFSNGGNSLQFTVHACGEDEAHTDHTASLALTVFRDGTARLRLVRESGTVEIVPRG